MKWTLTSLRSGVIGKSLAAFSIIVLLQVIYLGILGGMIDGLRQQVETEHRTRNVIGSLGNIVSIADDVLIDETEKDIRRVRVRKHLDFPQPSDKPSDAPIYAKELAKINDEFRRLKNNLADSPKYLHQAEEVESACRQVFVICSRMHNPKPEDKFKDPISFAKEKIYLGDVGWMRLYLTYTEIVTMIESIRDDYRNLQIDAQALINKQFDMLLNVLFFLGLAINVAATFLLYNTFVAGITNRIQSLSFGLKNIYAGKPILQTKNSEDEIDLLTAELNSMASRLADLRGKQYALLKNAASLVCALDSRGTLVNVGPASTFLLRFEVDELLGRKLSSLLSPDDTSNALTNLDKLFSGDSASVTFENTLSRGDGTAIDLSWSCRRGDDDLAICVAQDVTEKNKSLKRLKRSEEAFREIVEGLPVAVVTCDKSFFISAVNSKATQLFSYASSELLGKNLALLLTGVSDSSPQSIARVGELVNSAASHPVELSARDQSKSSIPVEVTSRTYSISESDIIVVSFKDISARFEIERVKKDFVAMISHDLRSPLTALSGTLEMMVGSPDVEAQDAAFAKRVGEASELTQLLASLINDFLDLEKFEAGMGVLEKQAFVTGELIERTCEKLESRIAQKLEVISDDSTIHVDVSRMGFVLSRLILVIAKCSDEGATIKVMVETSASEVVVKLTSSGLRLPKILEEGFQSRFALLSRETHAIDSASRLALPLSGQIVAAHGGQIEIERNSSDIVLLKLPTRQFPA